LSSNVINDEQQARPLFFTFPCNLIY